MFTNGREGKGRGGVTESLFCFDCGLYLYSLCLVIVYESRLAVDGDDGETDTPQLVLCCAG